MEEELMSQRDAAISLTKVLQRDVSPNLSISHFFQLARRTGLELSSHNARGQVTEQLERLEERAEAAERGRVRAEVALCQLTDAHEHHANADESQLSVIYRSWVCGLIGGWLGGAIVASMLSPALGFLLVVPCTSLCLLGGVVLAAVGRRAAAARRRVASYGHKEEYIALLGGAASQEEGGTGCGPPPPSRRQNPPGRRLRSGGSADGGDGGC
ncbi:unnamed protein product, partial [Phaeothamnion confervicola]